MENETLGMRIPGLGESEIGRLGVGGVALDIDALEAAIMGHGGKQCKANKCANG